MENTSKNKEWSYSPEEEQLAEHIIGLEKAALDKWFNGDTSGYADLWSKESFTYFDAVKTERVESHSSIVEFLKDLNGKLFAKTYDLKSPRVQVSTDTALLTFQLFAKTTLIDMEYNCIELYKKESDGQWRVIHSTWAFIRPMDKDFGTAKEIV